MFTHNYSSVNYIMLCITSLVFVSLIIGSLYLLIESEVAHLCPTLCNPVDCSLPGSSVHGILQARILGWVAISFARGSSQPRDRIWVSRIAGRLFNLWATREDSINTYTMLNKTPLLHQSSGPRVLFSLSLSPSLFQADPLECRGPLSSLSCPGF